tara:strand:+ start:791 stop:1663 length:873 start_codon:yes stop_codon:yes gene_type:complete
MKKYIFFISILFSLIIIPVVINNIKNYNQNLFSFKIKVINRIKNNTFQRCNIKILKKIPQDSSLIVGHAYGSNNKQVKEVLINKKLEKLLNNNKEKINNLIFSGDVLDSPTSDKWKKLYNSYKNINVHISPGNHDIGVNEKRLLNLFKNSDFYKKSFPYLLNAEGFNLIIEDSISSEWKISKEVVNLIKLTNTKFPTLLIRHNIPIRELVYLANSNSGKGNSLPSIKNLNNIFNKKITIISGDSGAFNYLPRFFCMSKDKIKIILNGIGGISGDTILVLYRGQLYRYILD